MTDQQMGYRVPYAFLFDLNNRFKGTYGQKVHTAGLNAMNDTFGRVLNERMVILGIFGSVVRNSSPTIKVATKFQK